jgi:hypothetical protein
MRFKTKSKMGASVGGGGGRPVLPDIDKQESKRVPLDLQTFIDFMVF